MHWVLSFADVASVLMQYWDLRTPTPVASIPLPERCYALDAVFPLMVVGCAERSGEKNIMIYDLNKPKETFKVTIH